MFQCRSTACPICPEENRAGASELLLLEANWEGIAVHLRSDWRSVGIQRDITTGLVDAEATAKGREGAGSFVRAAGVPVPGR